MKARALLYEQIAEPLRSRKQTRLLQTLAGISFTGVSPLQEL